MSEEEKAIENLKKNRGVSFKEADVLSNLIEKLQKEIEGKNAVIDTYKHTEKVLTEQIDELEKEIEDWKFTAKYVENNYISKDKIREKIEELDKEYIEIQERQIGMSTFMKIAEKYKNKKDILEELLEDN